MGFFYVCVQFFGSIIESIGHLSFCKKRDFYVEDSGGKMGHACIFFGFLVVVQETNIYIFYKKKNNNKSGIWDLISLPNRSFYRCVHTHFHVKSSTL